MAQRRSSRSGVVLLATLAVGIVGCSDQDQPATTSDNSPATENQADAPSHIADGILTIGLLVPTSDPNASFGPPMVTFVEAIVKIMNSFDGFQGQPIQLVTLDEGTTPEAAKRAAVELVEQKKADMVIGPFSATNAPTVIPALTAAGVGVCSPSVSSPLLDAFDDQGLFIRTGVQDTAVVSKMVDLAVESGSEEVSIAYPDDPYGRDLVRVMRRVLQDRDLAVRADIAYAPGTGDYAKLASDLAGDSANVELIIANPTDGPAILNAAVAVSEDSVIITNDIVPTIPVEFAAGQPENLRPQVYGFAPDVEAGGKELLNVIRVTDPSFPGSITKLPPYAVNTIDCLLLTWLSALVAESDSAETFKDDFLRVANDGASCLWVSDCKFAVEEDVNFNYEGISELNLDGLGVPMERSVILFKYDADGVPQVFEGTPNLGLAG